ncbi:MAG: glycosyltransferase family 2 protein, partial [Pseudonocardiaceae bacterium]
MAPLITVLTVTRRIEALDRCIDSVQVQVYDGPIVHQFVVDGTEEIVTHLTERALSSRIPIRCAFMPRSSGDADGPARLAVLRNAAVHLAESDYVAFLDDDNQWESHHLRSLWSTIVAEGVDIAHTERKLFNQDGSPYSASEFPWGRDEVSRRAIYA